MTRRTAISLVNAAILLGVAMSSVSAQAVFTPEPKSAERTAILNSIRVPVEKALKQKIVFVIRDLKVQGTWAFVSGEPQTPSGTRPNLKGTQWEGYEDLFDDNFFGLLRKSGGKWRVITHAIGCTDVCYSHWWKKYRAPKAIFPYTE